MESNIQDIEKIENLLKIGSYNKMYRVNFNGQRIYVQEEPFAYFSGLTGALSAATFKGDQDAKRLASWRNSMIDSFGEANTENYVAMTADFGTLLHMAMVTIKDKGLIKWDEERDKAYDYFVKCYKAKSLDPDLKTIKKIVYEYQKHVASLLQWVYERVQEIYAIEVPVKWDTLRIATPIDIFCSCRQTEKGQFANTTVNIKTSSQISNHQLEQISCEMHMWNQTYARGTNEILPLIGENSQYADFTGIIRTKDWNESKSPTYEYKYLTSDQAKIYWEAAKCRLQLCLNSSASYFPSPVNRSFKGETKIGEMPVIESKSLEEEWKSIEILES
jgi:hypothetical protein